MEKRQREKIKKMNRPVQNVRHGGKNVQNRHVVRNHRLQKHCSQIVFQK